MAKRREDQDRMEKDSVALSGTRKDHLPDTSEKRGPGRPPKPRPYPWKCPKCGGTETKVLWTSRGKNPGVYRVRGRKCSKCGFEFRTSEGLDPVTRAIVGPQREP